MLRPLRWAMQAGVLAVLTAGTAVHAQPASVQLQPSIQDSGNAFVRFFRDGEWYFSWGYNKEYWAPTDIHVSQASLGNNFTIHGVQGADEFSFPEIFSPSLFGPQYNIRIGRFINDERTIGVEFSLDHTKYTTILGQTAAVTGLVAARRPMQTTSSIVIPFPKCCITAPIT